MSQVLYVTLTRGIIVEGRADGLTQVWTMQRQPGLPYTPIRYTPEEPVYEIGTGSVIDFNSFAYRVVYSSLTRPHEWWDIAIDTLAKSVVKRKEVYNYDPSLYVVERHTAIAPDGVAVSISMVRSKDLDMTKPHPTMLYGYGSYGICIDPSWDMTLLPYLSRGIIYCIAHIRGGGENGRAWYETHGKYLTKRNTFQDFISCAEYLLDKGITTSSQLAIEGRSAGGLLMGAVVNMRPDLFAVVVAGVPFVDVMTTMCDPSIPLTTGEWEVKNLLSSVNISL